jgi:outer membrane receptor protein involved in Fe transport
VDASTFVTFGKEKRHKVTLRVENIFDKEYASGYATGWNTSGDSADFETYGLPRSVVVGYTYTF